MRLMVSGLLAVFLLPVAVSSVKATAITYSVDEVGLQSQQCFPNCSSFGSLTGTITTDGTVGVGLSPSIIIGWNLLLNDAVDAANLTNANSFISYNFSNLLSATQSELAFDFSPTTCCGYVQQNLEFTSSVNGARVVTIFAAIAPNSGNSVGSFGGIGIDVGYTGYETLTYLSGPGIPGPGLLPIGSAIAEPAPAIPEPSTWAMMLLGFAGVGFLAYRRKSKPTLIKSLMADIAAR
jgi:hypothetical protein